MAKKSIKSAKRQLKMQEKLMRLETRRRQLQQSRQQAEAAMPAERATAPAAVSEELLEELVRIDAMLHRQADIAATQFAADAPHLLQVIKSQPIGLETLLNRLGVDIVSSPSGSEFDADVMEADPRVADTADQQLHGMVARSVAPLFLQKGSAPVEQRIIQYEHVVLYNYKS